MAHQQGSVHIPIEAHTHTQAHTRTGLALVTQGSKSFQELGAVIVHTAPYYAY